MSQYQTLKSPNGHVTTAKHQAVTDINAVNSKDRKTQLETTKIALASTITITVVKKTLTLTTKMPISAMPTTQTTEMTENQELSNQPVRPVANQPLHRQMLFCGQCSKKTASSN